MVLKNLVTSGCHWVSPFCPTDWAVCCFSLIYPTHPWQDTQWLCCVTILILSFDFFIQFISFLMFSFAFLAQFSFLLTPAEIIWNFMSRISLKAEIRFFVSEFALVFKEYHTEYFWQQLSVDGFSWGSGVWRSLSVSGLSVFIREFINSAEGFYSLYDFSRTVLPNHNGT